MRLLLQSDGTTVFRRHLWTSLVLIILGTSLATLGSFSLPIGHGISGFWPAILVQVLGGIWFGGWGATAGTIFPIFSNILIAGHPAYVLGFIPANMLQSFLPAWAFRRFRIDPEIPDWRGMIAFLVAGTLVPCTLGGLAGAAALVLFGGVPATEYVSIALHWMLPNLLFAGVAGYPMLRILTPLWRENGLIVTGYWDGSRTAVPDRVWPRRMRDQPMILKLLLGLFAVGVLPFFTLSVIEIIRAGGRPPLGVNLVALFASLGTVIALLAAGYLSRVLTRPLQELQRGVETLTAGGKVSLAVDREDEVGRLAVSFEHLLSERRRSEEALRRQEEQLRLALEAANMGVWMWDVPHDRVAWSEGAARLLDRAPGASVGTLDAYLDQVVTADRPAVRAALETALRGERADYDVEHRVVTADGRVRWLQSRGQIYRDPAGAPSHLAGVVADITARRTAEETTRAMQERFTRAFYSSPNAMALIFPDDGRIMEVNEGWLRATGHTREETIGHTTIELRLWASAGERDRYIERFRTAGEVEEMEITFRRRTGELRNGILSAGRVDIDGRECSLVTVQDVTETRHLKEHLQQAQKMEALGRLAGGVAHDFNNLLTAILGYSDLLAPTLAADEEALHDIDEIRKAGHRAAALTQQLLAFSRKQVTAPTVLDLNSVVTDVDRLLRRLIGEDIEVRLLLAGEPMRVRVDAGQIHQLVMNLAVNARDAMPAGGHLVISTGHAEVEQADSRVLALAPGRYVRLSVSDTGTGMDPAMLPHIFEPFFTTKEPGKGTGLGLATVYGIVQQSGGAVSVESLTGAGTTFHVYFPAAGDTGSDPVRAERRDVPRGEETLLVVEDEPAVLRFAARTLTGLGYRVLQARDGVEALEVWDSCGDTPVSLLVSDVVMPNMGGRELSERLKNRGARLRTLFISGYADDPAVRSLVQARAAAFLEKPFTAEALARAVRDVLDH